MILSLHPSDTLTSLFRKTSSVPELVLYSPLLLNPSLLSLLMRVIPTSPPTPGPHFLRYQSRHRTRDRSLPDRGFSCPVEMKEKTDTRLHRSVGGFRTLSITPLVTLHYGIDKRMQSHHRPRIPDPKQPSVTSVRDSVLEKSMTICLYSHKSRPVWCVRLRTPDVQS